MIYQKFVKAQSIIMTAGSIVFPFYLLLINHVGVNYAQFGWAYGLFTLTSAIGYPLIGQLNDKIGDKKLLLFYSFGMALLMLTIPLITTVWHVYVIQIVMGLLGAIQKNTEKTVLARSSQKETAGKTIGRYHLKIALWSAFGVIATGYLIDFLTIACLFYLASILYIISFIVILGRKEVSPTVIEEL